MADVLDQLITDRYALWNGDCMEVMAGLPAGSIGLSAYSPPFATESGGLYHYSSSERDLSNSRDREEFFVHYGHVVRELHRLTMPGRMSAVHCTDIAASNTGRGDALVDFPGDIIRLHREHGWDYAARYHIWNEPLWVRNRTMTKGLAHKTIVDDSSRCSVASADYLLIFRRQGENPEPIAHPQGLTEYHGANQPPAEVLRYRGWTGNQRENRYSQWVWRQYASAFWDDIRGKLGDGGGVLPFQAARDDDDEKHVHPLQLDIIRRALVLWSNPGDRVFSPFMGVGSEVYGAVAEGRFGLGAELKASYYRQAVKNLASLADRSSEQSLLDLMEPGPALSVVDGLGDEEESA